MGNACQRDQSACDDVKVEQNDNLTVSRRAALEKLLATPITVANIKLPFNLYRDGIKISPAVEQSIEDLVLALRTQPDSILKVTISTNVAVDSKNISLAALAPVKKAFEKANILNKVYYQPGPGSNVTGDLVLQFAFGTLEEKVSVEKTVAESLASFEYRFWDVLMLPLSFKTVTLSQFDPEKDRCTFVGDSEKNLDKIAEVLKEKPSLPLRIFGFCGGDIDTDPKTIALSLARTRTVREALAKRGANNPMAAKGMGTVDTIGARVELAPTSHEDVKAIEKEVAEAEAKAKAEAAKKAAEAAAKAEADKPKLKLVFEENSKEVEILLQKHPMGLTFLQRTLPIKITKLTPGGEAEAKGVKVGMKLLRVDDTSIEKLSFEDAFKLLSEASEKLPKA